MMVSYDHMLMFYKRNVDDHEEDKMHKELQHAFTQESNMCCGKFYDNNFVKRSTQILSRVEKWSSFNNQ